MKQREIYEYFGRDAQHTHAGKEFVEIVDAYTRFKAYPSKYNLIHLVTELDDLTNVLEGIALVEHDIWPDELHEEKDYKLDRTLRIIIIMKMTGMTYDEVREQFDKEVFIETP